MRVTLLEDINALGPKGSTLAVPDGYAVNFLFPQHLAVRVEGTVMTDKDEVKYLKTLKPEKISAEQELAGEIDGLEVIIPVSLKAGKLVSPVTATEVRAALKELGYKIPKSAIKMEPISMLGSSEVLICLGEEFEAKVSVVVESAA